MDSRFLQQVQWTHTRNKNNNNYYFYVHSHTHACTHTHSYTQLRRCSLTHMWHARRGARVGLGLLPHQLVDGGQLADPPVHLVHVGQRRAVGRRGAQVTSSRGREEEGGLGAHPLSNFTQKIYSLIMTGWWCSLMVREQGLLHSKK